MKKFQETMKNIGAQTQMSVHEKDTLRENVFEYMKYKPITQTEVPVATVAYFFGRFNAVFAVLILLVISGVGASFTVPHAVPGDLLFGVKTTGEEIKMAVIKDEKKRALYAVERTYTRFDEQKRLTENGIDNNSYYLEESIAKVDKELARLAQIDPVRAEAITIAFEIGKEVHQEQSLAFMGGGAMLVAESQEDTAFSTSESSGEKMRSMKEGAPAEMQIMALASVPKDAANKSEVLPTQSEIVLSLEVLQELILIMENRINTLDNIDAFTQERVGELRKEISTLMQRGDLINTQRLVYDVLYIIERAAAGLDIVFPIEEEPVEPFDPSAIKVYELSNN